MKAIIFFVGVGLAFIPQHCCGAQLKQAAQTIFNDSAYKKNYEFIEKLLDAYPEIDVNISTFEAPLTKVIYDDWIITVTPIQIPSGEFVLQEKDAKIMSDRDKKKVVELQHVFEMLLKKGAVPDGRAQRLLKDLPTLEKIYGEYKNKGFSSFKMTDDDLFLFQSFEDIAAKHSDHNPYFLAAIPFSKDVWHFFEASQLARSFTREKMENPINRQPITKIYVYGYYTRYSVPEFPFITIETNDPLKFIKNLNPALRD